MKKLALAVMFLIGCSAPSYREGTLVSLGAYVPWDGSVYGVELCSYINGVVVKTPTNMCYEIQRKHSSTNDWCWGMLKTIESSDTTVTMKQDSSKLAK